MKPFDIELAKQGKPVCTKDGKPVRILCYDYITPENNPIVALVKFNKEKEGIVCYTKNGKNYLNGECGLDLMMDTEKKEGWINIYENELTSKAIYPCEEDALSCHNPEGYIATIKIEWEK